MDHLSLGVFDQVVRAGEVDHLPKLRCGVERPLAETLARRQGVADDDEQCRDRAQDRCQEPGRSCGDQGDAFRVLTAQRPWRHTQADVGHDHQGGDHDDECNPRRPAVTRGQRSHCHVTDQRDRRDGRDCRQQEQNVYVPRPILQNAKQQFRPLLVAVAFLAELVDPSLGHTGHRRLSGDQQPRHDDQRDGDQHQPEIHRAAPQLSSSSSCRANILAYSSSVAWSYPSR